LPPLYQSRFEIDFAFQNGIDIDVLLDEGLINETLGHTVSLIEVDRTDQSFQGIAVYIGVMSEITG
jgi:hypothetical protein